MLMVDPVRTKAALAEVAATFGALANEKFMLEAEHIQALPEDKREQAKLFADKQKQRIQQHVEVVRNHLNHYVDLLMLAEAGQHMPIPDSIDEAKLHVVMMHTMAHACMGPARACEAKARKTGLNPDGSQIPKE